MHAGPQALLKRRNVCRKVVHEYLRCFRMRLIVQEQVMGQLPYERVNPSRLFPTVGIDFRKVDLSMSHTKSDQKLHRKSMFLFSCSLHKGISKLCMICQWMNLL